MFLDIYAIQNVPPSNVNRDDTGAPKTAVYGGVERARVSSQAWKRAMRENFAAYLPAECLGVRTKLAVGLVADRIAAVDPDYGDRAEELATAALQAAGFTIRASDRAGSEAGKPVTEYLVFIARSEIDGLARVAIDWARAGEPLAKPNATMKKQVAAVFHGPQAVDVALFGRMLADAPDLNVDASAQVAHALSVDAVRQQYDYFTAVDDCAADDNAGAGMIGSVGFNSSTLYRYATVNIDALHDQLGDGEATATAVAAFVETFVRSMPDGKMNTFANRTLPYAVLVSLRENQPFNAVGAYEDPVRAREGVSISRQAAQLLGSTVARFEEIYGDVALAAWNVVLGEPVGELDAVSENVNLATALSSLHDRVLATVSEGA